MELQVASSSKRITPFDRIYVTDEEKALKEHGDNALMLFGVLQYPERQL
ncbi:hypothetical protein AZE42_09715 [Rhizopogon vesiculosus]|uniref:Uncharacterized protein n=1 Tax=Rhizopogon vesiculosus TaxID=180088 RepID=A0A1J8Q2Z5_9AGAM|nr:hypothetical protein AZE42_09715 [Rhizopogon vesiculosus]